MPAKNRFLSNQATLAWLGQFAPDEQPLMTEMLRKMLLVSRDQFTERMIALVQKRAAQGAGPVGLFAEREVRRRHGKPHRLFKETRTKIRRAHGAGPQPVQPIKAYDPDVGSEGIVAQIVSELCRRHPKTFLNHPGPDQIRKHRVRRFILVTDFIGSGQRAWTYLESAWRVRTVRSWWSSRARKGMGFEVVAYSGTDLGISTVRTHHCAPEVHIVAPCPTIANGYGREKRTEIARICHERMPGTAQMPAIGYRSAGALIAFAHGVPNNCPLVLHRRSGTWEPLFPQRITATSRVTFGEDQTRGDLLRRRLLDMRRSRLAKASIDDIADVRRRVLILTLAALSQAPRTANAVALRTGLTLAEVESALATALRHAWIDGANRLTDAGQAELLAIRPAAAAQSLPLVPEDVYCPVQLRAPAGARS